MLPVLIFPELQSTFLSLWATYDATATNTSGSFTDHPSPAFCPTSSFGFERGFTVGFQPSRNWSQTTSPKRSPPHLTVVFAEPFLARTFYFSALESRSRSPLSEHVRRPTVITTQRWHRYPRFQKLPPRSRCVLTFPELQAAFLSLHTGPPTAPLLPRPAAVSSFAPFPLFLSRFERGFTVGLQPSGVTVLQATSPERSPPPRAVLFSFFSPGYLLLWSHRSLGFLPLCEPVGP